MLLKKLLYITLYSLLVLPHFLHGEVIKGTVFNDRNANGKYDINEPGISNVSVSNGREIVLTDKKGRYQINLNENDILFVIKPSGWQLPLNSYNLPDFYYIHKPKGSPESIYSGSEPTGSLPDKINFPLRKIQEKENFKILIFGDIQTKTLTDIDYFARSTIKELLGQDHYLFGVSLGDIMDDNLQYYDYVKTLTGHLKIPWYNVLGNHDLNRDAKTDQFSDETYEANFGPTTYAFNYGKTHFLVLDTVMYKGVNEYTGGIRKDQLQFIKNDLSQIKEDQLLVLLMHIPLIQKSEGDQLFDEESLKTLFDLLTPHTNTLAIAAHMHSNEHHFLSLEDGWPSVKPLHQIIVGAVCGSFWAGKKDSQGIPISPNRDGTPKGYGILDITGTHYQFFYKTVGNPPDKQIQVFMPKIVKQKTWGYPFYANIFNASTATEVRYRIADQDWNIMEKSNETDPSYVAYLIEHDQSNFAPDYERLPEARSCSHLWKANLPKRLSPGIHTLEINAADPQTGLSFSEKVFLQVVD